MPIYENGEAVVWDFDTENFNVPTRAAVEAYEAKRTKARQALDAREESFQRCDTDGFLSQWAHGITAQEEDTKAKLALRGGLGCFWALYTLDGQRVNDARLVETKFGWKWIVRGKFLAFRPKRLATLAKHGFQECRELAPATVRLEGRGTGLSGTCWVAVRRTDGK